MWEIDRSASRGLMCTRGLYVFEHDSPLGNAPAHEMFDRIRVKRIGAGIPPVLSTTTRDDQLLRGSSIWVTLHRMVS